MGTALLRKSTSRLSSAGCVEALAEEKALMLALWLVHRPGSHTLVQLSLRLLHALAQSPAAAWAACSQGGAVYLLTRLLPTTPTPPAEKVTAEHRQQLARLL